MAGAGVVVMELVMHLPKSPVITLMLSFAVKSTLVSPLVGCISFIVERAVLGMVLLMLVPVIVLSIRGGGGCQHERCSSNHQLANHRTYLTRVTLGAYQVTRRVNWS